MWQLSRHHSAVAADHSLEEMQEPNKYPNFYTKNTAKRQKQNNYNFIMIPIYKSTIAIWLKLQTVLHSNAQIIYTFGRPVSSHSFIISVNITALLEIYSGLKADMTEFRRRALQEIFKFILSNIQICVFYISMKPSSILYC